MHYEVKTALLRDSGDISFLAKPKTTISTIYVHSLKKTELV